MSTCWNSLSANNVDVKCLAAINDNSWLWHRRLGHINFKLISKLARKDLVTGLPKIGYTKDKLCSDCQYWKQHKISFYPKNVVSSKGCLELVHMDLIGPNRTISLDGYVYCLVMVE